MSKCEHESVEILETREQGLVEIHTCKCDSCYAILEIESDCPHEEWTWEDCDKTEHTDGCFVSGCVRCAKVTRDCEPEAECEHKHRQWLDCDECERSPESHQFQTCVTCGEDVDD
jgi:hypothetical protein